MEKRRSCRGVDRMVGRKAEETSASTRLKRQRLTEGSTGPHSFDQRLQLISEKISEAHDPRQREPTDDGFQPIDPKPIADGQGDRNIKCAQNPDVQKELIADRRMTGQPVNREKEGFVPAHAGILA